MKKIIAFLCVLTLCLSAFPESVSSRTGTPDRSQTMVSLAIGKSYTINIENGDYYKDYTQSGILTDGVFCRYSYASDRSIFNAFTGSDDYTVEITVDLSALELDLTGITTQLIRYDYYNIRLPKSVSYYASEDGVNYTLLGDGISDYIVEDTHLTLLYSLHPDAAFDARYVRAVIKAKKNTLLYLGEICVFKHANVYISNKTAENGDVIVDNYGVGYRLSGDTATVVSYEDTEKTETVSGKLSGTSASFNTDETRFVIGKGTGNQLTVDSKFIPFDSLKYSKVPNNVNYIVIHNTGEPEDNATKEVYRELLLYNEESESTWHFTVDNSDTVFQNLPTDIVGWHAGDTLNFSCIGIEMCVNSAPSYKGEGVFGTDAYYEWVDEVFSKTVTNTAVLVAELLVKFGLGTDKVIQHYDVTHKNCPEWLRYSEEKDTCIKNGDLWVLFMEQVEYYYSLYTSEGSRTVVTQPKTGISLYDYITLPDGRAFRVTGIAANAFAEKNDIYSIGLSRYITSVSGYAFTGTTIEFILPRENRNYIFSGGNLYNRGGALIYSRNDTIALAKEFSEIGNIIRDIPSGVTVTFLQSKLFDKSARLLRGGVEQGVLELVRTGDAIKLDDGLFTAIVRGDVNCDGAVSAIDYLMTKRALLGYYDLDAVCTLAATISGNEKLTAKDYLLIKRLILNRA